VGMKYTAMLLVLTILAKQNRPRQRLVPRAQLFPVFLKLTLFMRTEGVANLSAHQSCEGSAAEARA
jgi:hypothetical protein